MRFPHSALAREEILLDTLAQSRTAGKSKIPLAISGEGSDLSNVASLMGRAKRKSITQKMILSLIDVAKRKRKPEQEKAYWNTYHCQNRLITNEGKIHSKYCKNRFCTLCLSIRKATIINKYLSYLETWEDPFFVTLTVRAIPAKELPRYCRGMIKLFSKIVDKQRKRSKRGKGVPLIGIRSLECNFNPIRKTYNPHFHIIVKNEKMAETFVSEWLLRFPKRHANKFAQHSRRIENKRRDLIELVKYGSKIFTEPDLKKSSEVKVSRFIYVSALDNIFTAMEGRRIFDRFGFNLPKQTDSQRQQSSKLLLDYEHWTFVPKCSDWVNTNSGETLTGYQLTNELRDVLTNRIDLELQ